MDANTWIVGVGGCVVLIGTIWFVVEFIRDLIDGRRDNREQKGR